MSNPYKFTGAVPVLASGDIQRSVNFYCEHLGFSPVHAEERAYGVVSRDGVALHFWFCDDRYISQNTSCRLLVQGIEGLFLALQPQGIVHPNATLGTTPWRTREFGLLDPDGNLVTLVEPMIPA